MLTRAHEKEFERIDDKNKPICWIAEDREENKHRKDQAAPYGEYGGWHKAAKVVCSAITTTLKNLKGSVGIKTKIFHSLGLNS